MAHARQRDRKGGSMPGCSPNMSIQTKELLTETAGTPKYMDRFPANKGEVTDDTSVSLLVIKEEMTGHVRN